MRNKSNIKNFGYKLLISLVGCVLFAISIQIMLALGYGLSPVDVTSQSIKKFLSLDNLGYALMIFHSLFIICILLLNKRLNSSIKDVIRVGVSALVISFFIYITTNIIVIDVDFFSLKGLLIFDIAFFLFAFSLYLIMKSDIIITPYEKFIVLISKKKNYQLGKVRLFSDSALILIAYLFYILLNKETDFSIVTILIALLTGIYIHLFELIVNSFIRRKKYGKN